MTLETHLDQARGILKAIESGAILNPRHGTDGLLWVTQAPATAIEVLVRDCLTEAAYMRMRGIDRTTVSRRFTGLRRAADALYTQTRTRHPERGNEKIDALLPLRQAAAQAQLIAYTAPANADRALAVAFVRELMETLIALEPVFAQAPPEPDRRDYFHKKLRTSLPQLSKMLFIP